MNTFASFFKKKPSQEEMETMIAGGMTASSAEQPAGQDSICFFAYIIEPDREYSEMRTCSGWKAFPQLIHDFARLAADLVTNAHGSEKYGCETRFVVTTEGNGPMVFPEFKYHTDFMGSKYIDVPIGVLVYLYFNGLDTVEYLMYWQNKEWDKFSTNFLNAMGFPDSEGTFWPSGAPIHFYCRYYNHVVNKQGIPDLLSRITDPNCDELEGIVEYLVVYAKKFPYPSSILVNALANSPAFKPELGNKDSLTDRVEYLSQIQLHDITDFQNVFLFVNCWYIKDVRLNEIATEIKSIREAHAYISLSPSKEKKIMDLTKEENILVALERRLSEICGKIEDLCSKAENEKTLSELKEYLSPKEGKYSKSEILHGIKEGFNGASSSCLNEAAGLIIQSELLWKEPEFVWELEGILIDHYKSLPNCKDTIFDAIFIKERMPLLDNISKLYVLTEKNLIVEKINMAAKALDEISAEEQRLEKAGREADDLRPDRVLAEVKLYYLKEMEVLLYEMVEMLEKKPEKKDLHDIDIIRKLSDSIGCEGVEFDDAELEVLKLFGLSDWTANAGKDKESVDYFRGFLKKFATITEVYYKAGFSFHGWGIISEQYFTPSLGCENYKEFRQRLSANEGVCEEVHPVYVDYNSRYGNEYNYIRSIWPCEDDYKDNKEDYLKILDRMANENEFSELEKLFDSRESFRNLCGGSLINDGFEDRLTKFIRMKKALPNCHSLIERKMLQNSIDRVRKELSNRAAVIKGSYEAANSVEK